MAKDLLGAAGIALTFVIFAPYARDIVRGTTRPHVFSWVIWALGTFVVFFAQLAGGAGVGAWPIGVSAAITTSVAVLAWSRRGDTAITRADWAFFVAALSALPCWFVTADPLWAVVILTLVDLIGFGPTVRQGWSRPHDESAAFFALAAVRNLLVVLALEHYSTTTVLFPAAVGVGCALLAVMLLHRRRVQAAGTRPGPRWRPATLADMGRDPTTMLSDADFDRAFCEWQEFGPQRAVPIAERWRTLLPRASAAELADAEERCREIESVAWRLAEQAQAGGLTEREGQRRLAASYPYLTAERVGRTWVQAMYFAAK
jgi:hypothetical protein